MSDLNSKKQEQECLLIFTSMESCFFMGMGAQLSSDKTNNTKLTKETKMQDSIFITKEPRYVNLTGMGPYLLSYSTKKDRAQITVPSEDSIRFNKELGENKYTLISDTKEDNDNSNGNDEIKMHIPADDIDNNFKGKQKLEQAMFKYELSKAFQTLFPGAESPISHINLSPKKQCEAAQIRLKNRQIQSVKKIIEDDYKNIKQGIPTNALVWDKIYTAVGGPDSDLGEKVHNSKELEDLLHGLG